MPTFVPRLTSAGMENSPYWYSDQNVFYASGYGLPNCTAYAYGRYYEAKGGFGLPDLPHWDAKDWYPDATAFQRGSTPGLGAVACWDQPGGVGHVAIVEDIYANGDILISESHSAAGLPYFDTQTLTAASGYMNSIYMGSGFSFQGFIYNDWGSGGGGQPLPVTAWQAKQTGGYNRTSNEAFQNAICTYRKLSALGWSLNAICGVYGNMEIESGYNPWRWESDDVPYYPSTPSYGYGLPQFTPSSKYISSSYAQSYAGYAPNWADHTGSPDDGDAQLEFIHNHADYISTTDYPLTFAEFKISTYNAGLMAVAWMYNYERPSASAAEATKWDRFDAANYWYGVLSQYGGSSPSSGVKAMLNRKKVNSGYLPRRRFSKY